MSVLDRKLFRNLWAAKGQALAISLVVSGGVATYVMSAGVLDSLKLTQSVFYRDQLFADVFASFKRAPESLAARIAEIPGVQQVQTRVIAPVNLDVEDYPDPISGQIVSVPDHGKPLLNRLYLRRGSTLDTTRSDEVLVNESFADAHGLQPGDHLQATINGKRKRLRIAGVVLSPEYVYPMPPGAVIPDFESYGILWMARTQLESAYDMEGAFNDVALTLSAGARLEDVLDRLDDLLERYGGLGAYGRKDQMSHRYLSEEFRMLEQMARIFPVIFLGVAAFLLNVVVSRLIATQREQAAILKAFGYTNADIVFHYLKFVALIVLFGVALGIGFGMWLGRGLGGMYMEFYRFPYLMYVLRPRVIVTAALVSAGAAFLGTIYSVVRAARQPPAEAMQPAPPARYRVSLVERLGLARRFSQPSRMILRNIERRPLKAALSVVGIAMAFAILLSGSFFRDAVDYIVTIQFKLAQRDDITVTFVEPSSRKAAYSLASLQGVEHVEGFRSVPARLRFEHRSYRTSIQGIPPGATLHRLLDHRLQLVELPAQGIVLTSYLAGMLGIQPGENLTVEVLEGERPVREVAVTGVVNEYIGVFGYMRLDALNRLMREGPAISGVYLETDSRDQRRVYSELKEMPRVLGASVRRKALRNFYETMAKQMLTFAFFNTLLAGVIAFGVVYNSARIAFSERARELASLRVLGFTRGEISYILLGELALLTLAALPAGYFIGSALCAYMVRNVQTEIFRIPLVIDPATYSFGATVILVSSLISGLIVRRKLDHLDLVAVLKTKE